MAFTDGALWDGDDYTTGLEWDDLADHFGGYPQDGSVDLTVFKVIPLGQPKWEGHKDVCMIRSFNA
eukprot:gene18232-17611_t